MAQQQNSHALQGETAQTLDRGLRVLEVLAEHPSGLSIAEIAGQLNLNRTIAYRLLNTLVAHRLVRRMDEGHYCLGMGVVELARKVTPRLQAVALPELRSLAEKLAATTCLTVRDGEEGVVLATIEPSSTPMHVAYRPGYRHPLEQGASGIAILAGRPPRPGERPEVALARQRGYAISSGEIQVGTSGIATPIQVNGQPAEASIGVILLGAIDEDIFSPPIISSARTIADALTR